MPAGEGREENEGEECEDDGDDEEVREHDGVFEGRGHPHKVEGVLVDGQILDERGCVVRADVASGVPVDADAEVADAHAELRITDDVCDCLRDARVDLFCGVGGCVFFVPHRDEEDAGYEW